MTPQENTQCPPTRVRPRPISLLRAREVQFAYRRFGPRRGTPLVLFNYLAANMDDWEPKVTNGLGAEHDVVIFNYPGVGKSSSETPSTVAALAKHCAAFCRAMGLTQFDIVGFSLGGMIAQQLAAEHPDLLRRIVLLGTGPRGGKEWSSTSFPSTSLKTQKPYS